MPIIDNIPLYEIAKEIADKTYKKPSAYKSMFIQKKYKELGGTYTDDNKPKLLKRWKNENWKSIADEDAYPVYRPTIRIDEETPLTATEIDPEQAIQQIKVKQKIKGDKNLPPFIPTQYYYPSGNPNYRWEIYDGRGLFIRYSNRRL
jgi:hypothetical protein